MSTTPATVAEPLERHLGSVRCTHEDAASNMDTVRIHISFNVRLQQIEITADTCVQEPNTI
jgi:hypothetical protein